MTNPDDLDQAKHFIRQRVWDLLERGNAAPSGAHGHIPDFAGKEQAAARLAQHDQWRNARVIKCNPDRAQLPVRVQALHAGKLPRSRRPSSQEPSQKQLFLGGVQPSCGIVTPHPDAAGQVWEQPPESPGRNHMR